VSSWVSAGTIRIARGVRWHGWLSIGVKPHLSRPVHVRGVYLRWRSVRKEAADIASRDDLHKVTTFHMSYLDKSRFKCQDERVVHGWKQIFDVKSLAPVSLREILPRVWLTKSGRATFPLNRPSRSCPPTGLVDVEGKF
jgi:hypothetical protein